MKLEKSCTLYIVRHGETEWNTQKIIQGHSDSSLTQKGLDQACDLREMFKDIKFDHVFSSDLLRAKRTAEVIAAQDKVEVKTTQALRERCFGRFEGKKFAEYTAELKELIEQMETLSQAEYAKHKLDPSIESDEELISRMIFFLRETALAYIGKNVLVVSHGGMIRALLIHLGFGTRQELTPHAVQNCAYLKLVSDGTDFSIEETHNIIKDVV